MYQDHTTALARYHVDDLYREADRQRQVRLAREARRSRESARGHRAVLRPRRV